MTEDMRSYLEVLKKHDKILEIKREVDPLTQLAGIAYRAENEQRKATLLHNLKGYPKWKAVSYLCGSHEKMALGLKTDKSQALKELSDRIGKLIKPKIVDDGPVKEIVLKDEEADISKIPVHVHSSCDVGCAFIGSGMQTVKDPETGVQNIALQRNQIKGKRKMGIAVSAGRHTDMIMRKYWKMGKAMPIAIVIGHHCAYYIGSTWTTHLDVDEIEIVGALLQEPVELIECETIDVKVPSYAEIIIEGEVPANVLEDEGPFGEHAGWSMGITKQPIINVKAITMRKDAIYYALQGGRPISESQPLDGLPMELVIYNIIKSVGGYCDIRDVATLTFAGGAHIIVVQMVPRREGEVRSVLMATLASPYRHPKIAIAVSEDVDARDAQAIWWSISTRVNPKKDVFIIPETLGHDGDSSLEVLPEYEGEGGIGYHKNIRLGSKMLIDATKGPSRWPAKMRGVFAPIFPAGYHEVKLEDFIG
ncbi:Phenolic acid decarboxylase [subsurface metagenome]